MICSGKTQDQIDMLRATVMGTTVPPVIEVKYVNYGVANRFGDNIELNEKLKEPQYKELHDYALKHEQQHTSKKASFTDMFHDFFGDRPMIVNKQYWNFLRNVPSSRIQLSPFYPAHGRIYTDVNLLVFYLMIICCSWILVWAI